MKAPLLAPLLLTCACALTSKSAPVDIRYFSPPSAEGADGSRPHAPNEPELRLGRVTSGAGLRRHILHRDSDVELGQYETLRWTENPEAYVRRAMLRALFDERPLRQSVAAPAPTLDTEVLAFEEVRRGEGRSGRVQIYYQLEDATRVLASGVVTVEREATGTGIQAVVEAISRALDDAAAQVASQVAGRLAS